MVAVHFHIVQVVRVPVVEETCPREVCFDILVDSLKQVIQADGHV